MLLGISKIFRSKHGRHASGHVGEEQHGLRGRKLEYAQVHTTAGDCSTLEGNERLITLKPSTIPVNADSDDQLTSEVIGGQSSGGPSHLCAHCRYMFDNFSKRLTDTYFRFPHYKEISQVEMSAARGCAGCAQFWMSHDTASRQEFREMMTKNKIEPESLNAWGVWVRNSVSGVGLWLEMSFRHNMLDESFDLSVDMIPVDSALVDGLEDRPIANTASALPLAARWLESCRKSHGQCNMHNEQYIPTRLISTEENGVRLCLSTDFEKGPEYATLSHCWGKLKFLTLQTNNLERLKNGIPQEALSKTFRDAIIAARGLSLSYIWIDSLCIIQDDPDDWLRESSLMSHVYGGSSLNIAATGAPDGNSGCFFERSYPYKCRVQIKTGEQISHYDCVPKGMYQLHLSSMPLLSRGWALQERVLPPRTLHFTSTQLFWECHQKVACETFPEEMPSSLVERVDSFFKKQPISRSLWTWAIENYSSCKLTYSKDKLIAISGIARHIQKQTGDQYIAGMWQKDLELQLCWRMGKSARRLAPYTAPTWSWASRDGPVWISKRNYPKPAFLWVQVLDIQLQFCGPDPLGQLSMANLCISCSNLMPANFKKRDYEYAGYNFSMYDVHVVGNIITPVHVFFDDTSEPPNDSLVMPVYGSSADDPNCSVEGLILVPTGQERGQYQRAGLFSVFTHRGVDAFKEAAAEPSFQVDSRKVYQIERDKDGKTRYIINLV
ncbi:heterokaryon incompatibility protein-domain-containing protein [Xylogone sp. PMI_703]|nr:heterokaryon incompatibility protein-domain-containing protein [Xylogone sp. PMI_703]